MSVAILAALAGALLLANLGNQYLWQDEAQTALLARSILAEGVPRGTDGLNFFSQEQGAEYGEDHLWRWHTWLPFYLVAASFSLLGESAFAARLPFALAGVGTVALAFAMGLALWRSRRAAFLGALMLALSVPFAILCRQSRWYGLAALLGLAGLFAYTKLAPGRRGPAWLLFGAATLLFHTHFLYCAALLAALLLHALLFERARLRSTLVVSAAVTLVNAPWIAWLASVRLGSDYAARLADPSHAAGTALLYLTLVLRHYFCWGAFLAIPLFLALERRLRGWPSPAPRAGVHSSVALLALYCGATLALVVLLAPGVYPRYLAPVVPALFLVAGLLVGQLLERSRIVGTAVFALWLALGSPVDFLYELTHDYDGPIEGIVKQLEQQARPGDRVGIVYGDMPLKFYTDLRVIGGLTGEDLEEARSAEWIILRRHNVAPVNHEVRQTLAGFVAPAHRCVQIRYPEIPFENREDPRLHRFRTAQGAGPVVICGPRDR